MEQNLKKLQEDMELRGFAENTMEYYTQHVKEFLNYWGKPAEEATENDISKYLHGLIKEKRLNPSTINKRNTALRFFYEVTLGKTLNLRAVPRYRTGSKLPVILSRDELWRLFDVCELKDKAVFI